MVGRTNAGSAVGSYGQPEFTYSGSYDFIDEGRGNWKIKFLTSGTLNITKLPRGQTMIDLFLVGGGGSGGCESYGGGGGGGYTKTQKRITPTLSTNYSITIGAGGTRAAGSGDGETYGVNGNNGGTTSAFGYSAAGGKGGGGSDYASNTGGGGNGGSGGGQGGASGGGGSNGGNGSFSYARTNYPENRRGYGQGTTTKEFEDVDGQLYAGGGGGNYKAGGDGGGGAGAPSFHAANGTAGTANTGGGGGGGSNSSGYYSGAGGSGIAIIRNYRG